MPKRLITQSIAVVVLASYHNPSILNHDFLTINGIIDGSWGEPKNFVSTPAYATVAYPEVNARISCQEERLQFDVAADEVDLIRRAASKYVEVLPHVKYTAIGVNCVFRCDVENPHLWLRENFLSKELLGRATPDEARIGLRFREKNNRLLRVDFTSDDREIEGTKRTFVQAVANLHIPVEAGVRELVAVIGDLSTWKKDNYDRAAMIIGGTT